MISMVNSTEYLEKYYQIYTLSSETEEEVTLCNSFYLAIYSDTKIRQRHYKKKHLKQCLDLLISIIAVSHSFYKALVYSFHFNFLVCFLVYIPPITNSLEVSVH